MCMEIRGEWKVLSLSLPTVSGEARYLTEPEAHNKTKWYNRWSQAPDSPTSSLLLPLLPQHWDYNVCPAFTWLLRIWTQSGPYISTAGALRGQLSPESETPFSKASAFSCDTRTELRVACGTDKALPLCFLSSQGTVSLHACFQGALPLSEQRRTRKSSSKGSCPTWRTLPSQSSLRDDLKLQIYTNENVLKLKK